MSKLKETVWVIIAAIVLPGIVHAQWQESWKYRRPITVKGCSDTLEHYQVMLTLDGSFDFNKVGPDGSDIAVYTAQDELPVPYWIETWDPAGEEAHLWLRIPLITAHDSLLYLYYGDSTAVSAADAKATFEVYDGFEHNAVGSAPWNENPGEWTRYSGNPILVEGPSGAWDDHGATYASVIYDSLAGEFRMYYHGFSFSGVHQIGLATSPDGLSWTKYPGNPIVTPGPAAWDGQSVRVPMVWKEGLTDYRMIYTGNGSGGMRVGYATSSDGISWTKHPANPVFNDPTWASGQTQNWGVMKVGDEYLMWYGNFQKRESGIAVSSDLVNWTPHTPGPIFVSSGDPNDDRYSQFCPFSFKYGDYYYVLVPSYSSIANYSKNYLYRSSSPYFPEEDRHLARIVRTVGPSDEWDSRDGDTPFVFTLDIERTEFFNDELWCYYSSEGGADMWKMGLFIEPDIAAALADAPLPSNLLHWEVAGDVSVTDIPVRSGGRSIRQYDQSSTQSTQLKGFFQSMHRGRVSAWMNRASTSAGDYDLYLYGGANLVCVAGLGRDGDFHYWDGAFQPTGVVWETDIWYLVTIAFNAPDGRYDFVVHDALMNEIVRVEGVSFGEPAASIDQAMLYTSSAYIGYAYMDDFRVAKWCGGEVTATLGSEEAYTTDASLEPFIPAACELLGNYPNPFNPSTMIRFRLPRSGRVTLDIYDTGGALIARLLDERCEAGEHAIMWDGRNRRGKGVGSGVYFGRLEFDGVSQTSKMVLLR